MIALVNTNENILIDISVRLHNALNSSSVKYTAEQYGEAIKHPDVENYALKVIQKDDYNDIIMNELTNEEKEMLQIIGEDWFEDLNI